MACFVASSLYPSLRSSRSCSVGVGSGVGGRLMLGRSVRSRIVVGARSLSMDSGSSPPPVNLPSSALLGLASILAISTIGCIFEISSGQPQYGTPITVGILAFSAPGFLFSYYAAIKKGQYEADQ
uniref:Uncharacterized protein n=1 Tax=Rhodosorus marinus TaxID=101924 RepID=A0A7S0BKC5_9RHOD|mmetsp:Transcript_19192/g.27810  ORF Transcript_19192/g.27810 Transcript_19192/m.27810 type:complete len:125 (+) Transcript_19192:81-455(+)